MSATDLRVAVALLGATAVTFAQQGEETVVRVRSLAPFALSAHDAPRVRQHAENPPMTMQMVDYRLTVLPWDAPMAPNLDHALGDGPSWAAGGSPTRVSVRLIAP